MKVTRACENGRGVDSSLADLIQLDNDPTKFNIVCLLMRNGALAFSSMLEFTHYPPGTPENDKFIVHEVDFDGAPMMVYTIPIEDRPRAEAVASQLKMRLADGTPHMFGPNGVQTFPMKSKRVWTLEGTAEVKSGIQGLQDVRSAEASLAKEYEYRHQIWLSEQPKRWIDGRWWHLITPETFPDENDIGRLLKEPLAGQMMYWYLKRSEMTDEEFATYYPTGYPKPGETDASN